MVPKKKITGYPSIDKPWLKYYSEEAINAPLPECTMYAYAYENNQDNLDNIAFHYYGTKITYRNFFEHVHKAAIAFYEHGVRAGDIVTIMSMHTPETIYALYALNYIGATANMVYLTLSGPEIKETLKKTESKLILVLEVVVDKVFSIQNEIQIPIVVLSISDSMPEKIRASYLRQQHLSYPKYLTWEAFQRSVVSSRVLPAAIEPDAMAVIVYTSGTTGNPKGVVLSNNNINSVAYQLALSSKNYNKKETALFLMPPFYGFGIGMLHLSISVGLQSDLWIEQSPEKILQEFVRFKPNRMVCGTSLIGTFVSNLHGDLSYLYEFTSGGSVISLEKETGLNMLLSKGNSIAKYTPGYGMTEFASVVCCNTNTITKVQSIGIPLIKANVKIIDTETGEELTYGKIGEMCFTSPNLMCGYYKNEEETKKALDISQDGTRWMHTGDLGYCDTDGFLFFTGRLKRIYTVRQNDGNMYKLFPQRIEEYFENLPTVKTCAVIVQVDNKRLHIPIVFLELVPESHIEKKKIITELMERSKKELPEHSQPERIIVINKIPFTSGGKIDYHVLEELAKEPCRE